MPRPPIGGVEMLKSSWRTHSCVLRRHSCRRSTSILVQAGAVTCYSRLNISPLKCFIAAKLSGIGQERMRHVRCRFSSVQLFHDKSKFGLNLPFIFRSEESHHVEIAAAWQRCPAPKSQRSHAQRPLGPALRGQAWHRFRTFSPTLDITWHARCSARAPMVSSVRKPKQR